MPLPERIAAVPAQIPTDLKDASPGHRFQLYLEHWQGLGGDAFEPYKKARPQGKDERALFGRECVGVLKDLCPLPLSSQSILKGILDRQRSLIGYCGTGGYHISTTSRAPFATGLGNEHPIENGFAFLTPYGLPYLAGSGVKGILRRAMQELRDEDEVGFMDDVIDALFGSEQVDGARRGALDFWDVFPSPAGGRLVVEIMTPHFGGYYQNGESPHDSGAPVPISFLAVPAKSQFDFHVVCHAAYLSEPIVAQWRPLLDRAFQHAFEWVGFGAKTSVGYGAMARADAQATAVPASASAVLGGSAPVTQLWSTAKLMLNPGTGEIKASFGSQTTAGLKGADAEKLRAALGEPLAGRLKKNRELKGVSVEVEAQGNGLRIKGLGPP